jgi:hypothetical protein|tara:strand:- start:234 stop:392 length:159 start_codon:yes stop_codon:yes gene_type:complete
MNRYDYKFNTKDGIKTITVKGKGIKQAIKKFNAAFLTVEYINKNGNRIITGG